MRSILELLLLASIMLLLMQSIIELDRNHWFAVPNILVLLYNIWTLKNVISIREE